MRHVIISTSAASRLRRAAQFLIERSPADQVLVVAASRGAADDLARAVARRAGATFGVNRFSLTELAARAAAMCVVAARRAPTSEAGTEALAARVTFDAAAAGELTYFGPVAGLPGFPRALARTLHELRLAGVAPERLAGGGRSAADIGLLLGRMESALDRAAVDDRAALFHRATAAWRAGDVAWMGLPIIFLDVAITSRAEEEFVEAVVGGAAAVLATVT